MVLNDREAPLRFLRTGYEPADWVAVFLKTYRTGETAQRVVSVSEATSPRFQSWLRRRNANSWNVYVSVNAVRPGRSRSRDAICGIRHVFLEEDADGPGLLASLTTRPDLPPPSYVLHSSPGRIHVFWRVRGFDSGTVETMQKRLARELRSDTAATSCAQTTRLPGFANYKRLTPFTGHDRIPASECGLWSRRFSSDSVGRSSRQHSGRVSSALISPIVRLAPSAFSWLSSLPLPGNTATCARFESVVAWFADSSFQITRRCPFSPSGTHGVSRPGPSGSC